MQAMTAAPSEAARRSLRRAVDEARLLESARRVGDAVQPFLSSGEPLAVVALGDDLRATMEQVGRPVLEREAGRG